jgi:hypothetical protein
MERKRNGVTGILRNCWDKEHKEVVKEWTGGPRKNANSANKTWNFKNSLLEVWKGGPAASSGWVKA